MNWIIRPNSFTTERTETMEIFKDFLCALRELCGEKMFIHEP